MKLLTELRAKAAQALVKSAMQISPKSPSANPGQPDFSGRNRWIAPAAQVRWLGPGMAFYTPQRVEQIWRQALSGDLQSEWEMFDIMMATAPRMATHINQLKDNVLANGICIAPFRVREEDPTDEAKDRAAFVEEALTTMRANPALDENNWNDTMRDLMSARFYGLTVVEIAWELRQGTQGMMKAPRASRYVHPAWYGYPFGAGAGDLKLKSGQAISYMSTITAQVDGWYDFPPDQFVIGLCKNKSGHPLGSAVLHTLGFWWAAANFSGEWLLNMVQIFGQPFRWATYSPNMTPNDQNILAYALANMGSQAWAMFPEGTEMEFKEAMRSAGDAPQKVILDYFDKLCEIVILRQTLTTDVGEKGGARSQGEVHERVLGSVETAIALWLCKTLQPLVDSICLLNFGTLENAPHLEPESEEDDESTELSTNLNTLAQAGLEPTDAAIPDLGKRLGFEIQRKAPPEPLDDADNGPDASPASNQSDLKAKDAIEQLASSDAQAVAAALRENFSGITELINGSQSPEELNAKLKAYFADWRPAQIVKALEPALQKSAALGAISATTKPTTK